MLSAVLRQFLFPKLFQLITVDGNIAGVRTVDTTDDI